MKPAVQKILIIGSPGSGKSTLAHQLTDTIHLPVIHLDKLYHEPGRLPDGAERKRSEWRKLVQQLIKQDRWVMDGNYGSTLDIRISAAEFIIFLDYPRYISLWRAFKRGLSQSERPDMPEGWQEKLNLPLFQKIWYFPQTHRPKILKMLNDISEDKYVVLSSPKQTRRFYKRTLLFRECS